MSDENLFNASDCDIQFVPVVDFEFLPNDVVCEIIPTPGPIFSCELPVIVPEPPTDVGVECPVFSTKATVQTGYAGSGDGGSCPTNPTPRIRFDLRRIDVDPCDYELDFDIDIPIPRPPCEVDIVAGEFQSEVGYVGCVTPGTTFTVTKINTPGDCDTPDRCEYTIDLRIGIPIPRPICPVININTFDVESGPENCLINSNYFYITPFVIPGDCDTPDTCAFDIDLGISVPIPVVPCPTIRSGFVNVSSGFSLSSAGGEACQQNFGIITVTPTITDPTCDNPTAQCEYEIGLDISVAVPRIECPTLNSPNISVAALYESCITEDINTFTITPRIVAGTCNTPDRCEYDFDLILTVPIPTPTCPIISDGVFNITSGFFDANSGLDDNACGRNFGRIYIEVLETPATCDTPPICEYSINLDLGIAVPRVPCPDINVGRFYLQSGFKNCVSGENRFEIVERHVPGANCQDPGRCQFDVELELTVPIPEIVCPVINITSFSANSSFATKFSNDDNLEYCAGDNNFSISVRHVPASCERGPECIFDVALDIFVPIPRVPCPIINKRNFSVTSGYAPCVTGENKFEITTKHVPPTSCDDPGSCQFDVELQVFVPIPQPTCPVINPPVLNVVTSLVGGTGSSSTDPSQVIETLIVRTTGNPFTVVENGLLRTYVRLAADLNEYPVQPGQTVLIRRTSGLLLPLTIQAVIDNHVIEVPINGLAEQEIPSNATVEIYEYSRSALDFDSNCGGQNRLTVTANHTPATCDSAPECKFDMALDIFVPIPRMPCPIITTTPTKLNTGYDICVKEPKAALSILERHTAPNDCDDTGQCSFELALEIDIPIPTPTCPAISVGDVSIVSGLSTSGVTTKATDGEDTACGTTFIKAKINENTTKAECDVAPKCEFSIDLDLGVFVPRVPCPIINRNNFEVISGFTGAINQDTENSTECPSGENLFTIATRHVPGETCDDPGTCEFDVDLAIWIPIPRVPCPTINIADFKLDADFQSCLPENAANKFTVTTNHIAGQDCNDPGSCAFDLELNLAVPIPEQFCPIILPGTVNLYSGFTGGNTEITIPDPFTKEPIAVGCSNFAQLRITPNEQKDCSVGPVCDFVIDFDLGVFIPKTPCPLITIDNFETKTFITAASGCETVGNKFEITTRHVPEPSCDQPDKCEFGIDFALSVPIPKTVCPVINVTKFDVQTKIVGAQGCQLDQNIFKIDTRHVAGDCNTQDQCIFDTELAINVPIPPITCPIINVTKFDVTSGFEGASCLGDNRFVFTARETPGTCNSQKTCTFDAELSIAVPVPRPRCPTINRGNFSVSTVQGSAGSGNSSFEIRQTKTVSDDGCRTVEECEYYIDLEIEVPIPKQACPILRPTLNFNFESTNQDEGSGSGSFVIQNNSRCLVPGSEETCLFDLILNLDFQIPRSCTPELIVGNKTIAVGYDESNRFDIIVTRAVKPDCDIRIDFDIGVRIPRPPCTVITTSYSFTALMPGQDPYFVVTSGGNYSPGDYCEYALDFQVGIPRSCLPNFVQGTVSANWFSNPWGLPNPTITFTISQVSFYPCVYKYDLSLYIPQPPKPPCPVFVGQATKYATSTDNSYDITLDITQNTKVTTYCQYDYQLNVTAPEPPCRVSVDIGTITVTGECVDSQFPPALTPTLKFNQYAGPNYTCLFLLEGDIPVYTPPTSIYGNVYDSDGNKIGTVAGAIECEKYSCDITLNTVSCDPPAQQFKAAPFKAADSSVTLTAAEYDRQFGDPESRPSLQQFPAEDLDDSVLLRVTRNLEIGTDGKPVNPQFFAKMKQFVLAAMNMD